MRRVTHFEDTTRTRRRARSAPTRILASAMALALTLGPAYTWSAPGEIVTSGTASGITVPGGFRFEPEVPFTSLKNIPTWSEIEQLLDNPYIVTADPSTPGNDNGFPSYRATGMIRRPGFGVTLPALLVHPLNYNPTTGEEMRLINPQYPGGTFGVVDQLVQCNDPVLGPTTPGCDGTITVPGPTGPVTTGPFSADRYVWRYVSASISPGADRVEPGEAAIDYNSPVPADPNACVISLELVPPEGATLCGHDPGEPGNPRFGVRDLAGYSVPAVQLPAGSTTGTVIPATARLYDPARGVIQPRNPGTGAGGLRKPSLRVPAAGGTPANPNYLVNANLDPLAAAPTPSNENDYVRNAPVARTLGKALFWDMQVGSDGVQSCGTCHFNGTGTDTRTKNQLNPNHLGGDPTLQIGDADIDPAIGTGKAANYTLKASDFPLHKVRNPDVAGDPACTTPLTANTTAIPYAAATPGLTGGPYLASQAFSNPVVNATFPVCDAANVVSDVNDVVSSMGVHFGRFKDVAPIGTFVPAAGGVAAVAPDLRATPTDCCGGDAACVACSADPVCRPTLSAPISACLDLLSDPIPAFGGVTDPATGLANQFRRVEPRNTPTMQAAGFNFDNFWDGRARHDFNGGSVFGAADPQSHVWVASPSASSLTATRQIIRFVSIASLATGPGLSEFEMSFQGRNWSKVGKKLLQGTVGVDGGGSPAVIGSVTPLANQLVDPTDSLLGIYSNQGGTACAGLSSWDRSPAAATPTAIGKPGLCISYPGLIRQAFYPALWRNVVGMHLNGCYTDGNAIVHPNQCGAGSSPAANVAVLENGAVVSHNNDPFDGYVLTPAAGGVNAADTNQFRQMEGNFSLFWGLAVQSWVNVLVPDDTPLDQFLDLNPGAFSALGEPGEPGLVPDQLNCGQAGADPNYCFRTSGNFKRDPGVKALQSPTGEGGAGGTLVVSGGNRNPNDPDPLLGADIFFASNLSLKNPNFRTGRCGECHAIPTLTDHTMPFTSKINLSDAVAEFSAPGVELIVEPLARLRVISGFLLESEINENGQDAVERRIVDQSIVPNTVDGLAYPGATAEGLPWFPAAVYGNWTGADQAFLDNGVYNLGVRPIAEDTGRGGNDAFGWPLSIATLMMKNLEGPGFNPGGDDPTTGFAQPAAPGAVMSAFDPEAECFGLFEPTAQDQQINPGCDGEPASPQIPPYLGAFVNNITVGDFPPELDEAGGAIGGMVNTLTDAAMIEGFMDSLGPFNPANVFAEVMNYGGATDKPGDVKAMMGTWPNVNRVGRMGSFKAAPLRNVELTGPYFHNGGKLTLRQVVDFYNRGGDFPLTNAPHRDFNIVNQNIEIQSNLSEAEKVALVDFLLELTDERNRYDRAPFDHPEVIVPVDGLAPDNTLGRAALLGNPMFRSVSAVGAGGMATPEPAFLNVTRVRLSGAAAARPTPGNPNPECDYDGAAGTGRVSHYCH
jgi:cytochrome c peroxidase